MLSSNTDLARTRQTYQEMSNEELLGFAEREGFKLTSEAYLVLKHELQERNIGADILHRIEHEIILRYSLQEKNFEKDVFTDLFVSCLEFALEAKRMGASQYDIYAGLIERGITQPYANYMINKLDEWAASLQRDSLLEIQTGAAMFALGLIWLYFSIKTAKFEVVACLLIIAGLWRMLLFLDRKRKYKKIIDIINRE